MDSLMQQVDQVRLKRGVYDQLLLQQSSQSQKNARFRIAPGGKSWDCLLHVLPEGSFYQGRWPTGSWSVLKTLIGVAEISSLVENNSGQLLRKRTTKDLRGGSDGSLAAGQSSGGAPCVKYVGGPLRRYSGKYGKTVMLEVVVRPPIGKEDEPLENIEELSLPLEEVLSIFVEPVQSNDGDPSTKSNAAATIDLRNATNLGKKMGMSFDQVGGLDKQLDAIARRVLASRANGGTAAKRLGISHVRGVLLSGPPGCGKTLLARELARILGAREPQICNGPEILDKYIGEAEKRVRELFAPAEEEYKVSGDDSALHIIILDEMDAIARKRGTMTSDTTGVRDSVVNQLLSKMDGVQQAPNVLVVGLTNRPELLDPALLRPGRLEVQLRVELPDRAGRRDILRIHTRQMKEDGALSKEAAQILDSLDDDGIPALTEHFSGAELAGLVRSAASFALVRSIEDNIEGVVGIEDLRQALLEVRPALGRQDDVLKTRYPLGVSSYSDAVIRVKRELTRFTAPINIQTPRLHSMLLVGGAETGGSGVTALAAWAAACASVNGSSNYVRFISALDLLASGEGGGDDSRAAALVEKFSEASEMSNSLLVLDDVDQLCAGPGPDGYSTVMLATLRALLRQPPPNRSISKAGGHSEIDPSRGRSLHIIGTSSRTNAACDSLQEIFEETIGKGPMSTVQNDCCCEK